MRVLGAILLTGVLEIVVLILVGRTIGGLPTLALVIAGMVAGSWLLRRQGRRVVRELSEAALQRRAPTVDLGGGVFAAAAGVLLMVPGFLSDLAAIVLLLPPTRALLGRRLRRAAEKRAKVVREQVRAYRRDTGGPSARGDHGDYIDGEVVSVTEDSDDAPEQPPLDRSAQEPGRRHRDRSVEPGR